MAVFNVNQVRHLYVLTEDNTATVGETLEKEVFIKYKGAGGNIRTDLIPIANITSAHSTEAAKLARNLKSWTITLSDSVMTDGHPVYGQDYELRLLIMQAGSLSPEDQYFKYGVVHATADTTPTAAKFYEVLGKSLQMNIERDLGEYISVEYSDAGVVINELAAPWRLHTMQQESLDMDVAADYILISGEEVCWGAVELNRAAATVPNSKDIADLEEFCMGERGDNRRLKGWPLTVYTDYLVNPNSTAGYNVVDINYYYAGGAEDVQKSPKTLTIVAENTATGVTALNTLITALNGKIGAGTIAALPAIA